MSSGLAAGMGAALPGRAFSAEAVGGRGEPKDTPPSGHSLAKIYQTARRQLFEEYLPFWERGGIDRENGGFMCYLYEDGTVQDDRKDIWYQGRGIWVYAYLYNTIDPDPKWLKRAQAARDFMVEHMHRGDGTWLTTVDRLGRPVGSIAVDRTNNIYGALFAAAGLIQLAKATGREADLELAGLSIRKSVERYEDYRYRGVAVPGIEATGLRAQGHSFMFVWVLPQLLELQPDPRLEAILEEHLDALEKRFWNPEYGISNEVVFHDYTRIPSQAGFMVPGHSIEAQWMGMEAALRYGDAERARLFARRMRRLIEMSWDYVFGGTCDTGYRVFAEDGHPAGPVLDLKTMWAQTEVVIGCLLAGQRFGEEWAQDWLQRSWNYLQQRMTTEIGVWRQAVDRKGHDRQREGISVYRRGNFHQPRCLMMILNALANQTRG